MSARFLRLAVPFAIVLLMLGLAVVSPVRAAPMELTAQLSGAAEVPGPGDPDGMGDAFLRIDPEAGSICPYFIGYANIGEPIAAHIHEGAEGVAGPPVVDLFDTPSEEGFIESCLEGLDSALLQSIVADPAAYYVNVHTAEFGDGAIRGQLALSPPPEDCTPPELCGSHLDGPGTAIPGDYVFDGFASRLSFSLAEPWISVVVPDGFILLPSDSPGEIFVGRLEGSVFTDGCGATPATIPISTQSYVEFFATHPNVSTLSSAQPASIGGASGVVLDIQGTGTAGCDEGIALLMQASVDEGLPPEAGQYVIADGERIRVWLVEVAGETIIVAVSDWAEGDLDALMTRAQPVINSMVFALGGEPTPAPTAQPTAAPSATAAPAATAAPLPDTATPAPHAHLAGLWLSLVAAAGMAAAGGLVLRRRR